MTQLTFLDLSGIEFTGSLPSLERFSNLAYLSLSDVNLYGEIPSSFFNLTRVGTLVLSRNQLIGQLPSSLLNLQNLESFYLDGNNATVDFYLFLSLKNLNYLNLRGNNIRLSVIDSHKTETQFKVLWRASCNLKVFPEFLRFQHQLEFLYLDNNKIEGLIPGWMWNISKETLIELRLSQNLLMGFEQHSLVAPWVNLMILDLSHNMLHGSIPLPPPLTYSFSVSNNKLTGEIPPSICNLIYLQSLDLSFNIITGSIPPCLEKLSNSNLVVLNLRNNALQGTIPNVFTNKSQLEMID
ncbi:putative non-specific serine/threonine protein kinase [Helianthus annuus]|nr:putative non-specific serine/threonine protein kinase [Helianthus annuus]